MPDPKCYDVVLVIINNYEGDIEKEHFVKEYMTYEKALEVYEDTILELTPLEEQES